MDDQNKTQKTKFALFFGNRGFFPGSLMASAREEMVNTLKKLGHDTLVLDADATRHGAVETPAEGEVYAQFLKDHAGEFGGVILCLPNFGDETGAAAALQDAGVPILIHAYPDELDKMAPELRRDAFCGKFSIMDVFCQYGIKFTALEPHTVSPASADFAANIDYFDRLCRVVGGLKKMRVGAIGARTSAFKTVRIDELALQKNGITMETFDLADVFHRMQSVSASDASYTDKAQVLNCYSDFSNMPTEPFDNLVKLAVVIDAIIEEAKLDAVAIRCWVEMQQILNMSPCVVLSELNNRRVTAACLDWNNNYGDEPDKCILFHCGPVPQSMMSAKGRVTDHAILANAVGPGCSFGCNVGRIAPTDFTFSSMMTDSGRLKFFVGEGKFTADHIPADFFGCAGVAEIPKLQQVLLHVGRNGHRHHVSVTPSHVADPVREALECYLGFAVASPQRS